MTSRLEFQQQGTQMEARCVMHPAMAFVGSFSWTKRVPLKYLNVCGLCGPTRNIQTDVQHTTKDGKCDPGIEGLRMDG